MNKRNHFKSGFLRAALMLLLAVMTFPIEAWADDYYYVAEFDGTNKLTFKKTTTAPDNQRTSFDATNTGNRPGWRNSEVFSSSVIAQVVFDTSFADARPTSCCSWFDNYTNLCVVLGLENLNTSQVTNMARMFNSCGSLTSLDLSHFDTSKVTDMSSMFQSCIKLSSLDLSNFDTSNVGKGKENGFSEDGSMNSMFARCSVLTSVILPTKNLASIDQDAFQNCSLLASITIPASVTKIGANAFAGCTKLAKVYALPSTAPTLGINAFNGVYQKCQYYTHGTYDAWSINNVYKTIIWATTPDTKVTTTTPVVSHGGKDYYTAGATATLGYSDEVSVGYAPVYTAKKASDNSDVTSTVISGSTLTMPDYDVTITATLTDLWGVSSPTNADGSGTNPYVITSPAGLDLLAKMVNGTDGYTADNFTGKYFVQDNDITYSHKEAGTTGADTENNYTAIGNNNVKYFNGSFDGRGHTVSGIRIYKNENYYQGLFGIIGPGCSISHVTLDDARIVGYSYCGGIVGGNSGGKITDCHVTSDVKIIAINNCSRHGGIIGTNESGAVVSGCTSAAQIIAAEGSTGINQFGGIVGFNSQSTIQDCLYLGSEVSGNMFVGAIAGCNDAGTILNCYYTAVGFVGKDGSGNDITLPNGNPAIGYSNVSTTATNVGLARTITLGENVTLSGTTTGYSPASPYTSNIRLTSYATAVDQPGYALKLETVSGNTTTTTYYIMQDATVTLGYSGEVPSGYAPVYTATKTTGGADVTSTVISGSTLTMPDYDVTITATLKKLTAYAVLSEDGKTLTFKYEVHTVDESNNEWDVSNTGTSTPGWYSIDDSKITTVVFDESFADARPKSCMYWFQNCSNLTAITGLNYFNTSGVTNMSYMFNGCSSLTSLDLSNFNTSGVTNMSYMFDGCSSLTSLDLSNFNTSEVTDMHHMFDGCSSLTSLDLSNFSTGEVTDMNCMFDGCSSLTSLNLSNFNTSKVTNMNNMFSGCSSLKSLAIGSGFTVGSENQTYNMFLDCTALAEGMLIVNGTGSVENNDLKPSIVQDIFKDVFTNGTLATNLTATQLGASGPANGLYTWKDGKFKSVGAVKIPYIDENGKLHNDATSTTESTDDDCAEALPITSSSNGATYPGGWYFVAGDVTIKGQLKFTGNAHLILCDGAAMTVGTSESPISAQDGAIFGNWADIIIYGQSTDAATMGSLTACGTNYGINAPWNEVIINGGRVIVTGKDQDGIFASDGLTINGGWVAATGGSDGMASPQGPVIINGGQVEATGGSNGNGIFTLSDEVTINGGQVTATGGTNGSGIYAGDDDISLGWTKPTDFIQASSYYVSGSNSVKIPQGKYLYKINDNSTTVWGRANTDEVFNVSEIAGKTLRPAMVIAGGDQKNLDVCLIDGNWKLIYGAMVYAVTGYDTETGTVTLSEAPLAGVPEGVPVVLVPYNDNTDITLTVASSKDEAEAIQNSVPSNRSSLFIAGDGVKTMAELIAAATGTSGATGEYMVFTLEGGVFRAASFSDASVPAEGKCFLVVSKWDVFQMIRNGVTPSSASGARGIPFDLGETTGISLTPSPSPKGEGSEYWYSLDGRKLDKAPTKKGVYVRSGVKVIIK